ncbi:hypothetical protein V6Z11_D10G228500 [Gossypium hirsutum]
MGDFWSLWEGHNPSFVWRSICAAKGLLARGFRWQLDDDDDNFYVASSSLPGLESLRVTDLLQLIGSAWDVDIIDGLMVPSDIIRTLQIPVSLFHTRDRLIWHYEKHGIYTVKSAYRLAFNMFESTRYVVVDGPWLKLWNSTLPPKSKIYGFLLWYMVPTAAILKMLLSSGGVRGIFETWSFGRMRLRMALKSSPLPLGFDPTDMLHMWVTVKCNCRPPCGKMLSIGSWSPPLARAFKCNVDSAQQQTEFANVLRDAQGSFVKAFLVSCPALLYPRLAEEFTVREALSWLKSEGYLQVILEGDCLEIFSALCTASPNFSEFGVLLEDCHFLQTYFQSLTFASFDGLPIGPLTSLHEPCFMRIRLFYYSSMYFRWFTF